MDLSVIVPCYNAEGYIVESLTELASYLTKLPLRSEVIVVDDGSSDQTAERLNVISEPMVKVVALTTNQGKFAALKLGIQHATGRCCVFTDADLPYDLSAIHLIFNLVAEHGFHLVVGDRTLAASDYSIEMPLGRRLATRVFSSLVRHFLAGGLGDTQCGIKGFGLEVAKEMFPLLRASRFDGDLELMFIASRYNLALRRIPVRLRRRQPSTVRVFRHGTQMILRAIALPGAWASGCYNSQILRCLGSVCYWDE